MPKRPPPPRPASSSALVWERSEPQARPAPTALTRARIVRAALGLADKRGLEEVSLRKVGAKLGVVAMRLYGYVDTKEELLELMVDSVYGEMGAAGPLEGDWRSALTDIAQRLRRAAQKHGWFIDLLGGRPHLGPHALTYLEASLAALAGSAAFADIDDALGALRLVNAYALGALRAEASELRAEQQSGLGEQAYQLATLPYLQRQLETGQFPQVSRVIEQATHPPAGELFDQGLACVLDGLAQRHGC